MSDMRLNFEHQFKKWCGIDSGHLLKWNEEYKMYSNPDTNLSFIWYCRGYYQGERS